MEDFSNRVVWITQELRALQQQLQWAQFQRSSPSDQDRILDNLLSIGLVEDLKSAIDHLRHFLWCYIESAATNISAEVDYASQSRRLRQITEMLRLLRSPLGSAKAPLSFLDQITLLVSHHLETENLHEAPLLPPPRAVALPREKVR